MSRPKGRQRQEVERRTLNNDQTVGFDYLSHGTLRAAAVRGL